MKRRLEPEWLDKLPAGDPAAIVSRRDLVRINGVMGQHRVMASALGRFAPPRMLLDLGGGDGRFLLRVARRLPWRNVTACISDRQDIVSDETRQEFAALGWRCEVRRGDVFTALNELDTGTIVIANLFLHHLTEPALVCLFAMLARGGGLVACEPRRNLLALAASHMVFALGCNRVTRHDAIASVRAGFSGNDLSGLWPKDIGWRLTERHAPPFSHAFLARRHDI
jgi:hypothetical protein